MDEQPPILITSADGAREYAKDASAAILFISLAELQRGHVGDLVDRLMVFSDDSELIDAYEGAMFIVFDGFDDDPRELPDIPEVRAFFRKVDESWPFWFHFLNEVDAVPLAVKLLVDSARAPAHDAPGSLAYTLDLTQLEATIDRCLNAQLTIGQHAGLSPDRIEIRAAKAMSFI